MKTIFVYKLILTSFALYILFKKQAINSVLERLGECTFFKFPKICTQPWWVLSNDAENFEMLD